MELEGNFNSFYSFSVFISEPTFDVFPILAAFKYVIVVKVVWVAINSAGVLSARINPKFSQV